MPVTNDSTITQPRRDWSLAIGKASRTSSSFCRSRQTPRPWLPSSGLTTTGKPIRLATVAAWSAVRTDSCLGTGSPAAPSSRVVRSLSEAMSTAIELVSEVIVARMRLAWTPCPSCTSECLFSRIHGMSRETASSMIACVDGPNAVRCARRMNVSSSSSKSKCGSASTRWLTRRTASRAGLQPDLLVDVPEDDVVAALVALDLARLAAPDVVADDLLQCQRGVLGDVTEPGALVQPLDEAAAAATGAGVLAQAGQRLEQAVGEVGERVGGVLLEDAEVDHEVDGLVVGPDVGPAVDAGLDDGEIGGGAAGAELRTAADWSLPGSVLALSLT